MPRPIQTLSRWQLPEVVHPEGYRCYQIMVPDERFYIAAFEGLLVELTYSKNWARDEAHTAAEVSRVWQDIIDASICGPCSLIGADDVQFRQNGCLLEFSIDCVHWQTLYDPTECIAEGATQHGPGGTLAEGECQEYTVTLAGNGRYLLPVPVEAGYVVTISDSQGGWNDGSGALGWFCPDGKAYGLGLCAGGETYDGTDPAPLFFHGQAVASFGSQFAAASDGSFTIPPGEPSENLEIFMNDASLPDNAGSISFKIKVCAEAVPTFTHLFDFTIDDQGWAVEPGEAGLYNPGLGWDSQTLDVNNHEVGISISFASVQLTGVTMTFDRAGHSGANANNRLVKTGTPNESIVDSPGSDGTALTLPLGMTGTATKLFAQVNAGASNVLGRITSVEVSGLGVDPF